MHWTFNYSCHRLTGLLLMVFTLALMACGADTSEGQVISQQELLSRIESNSAPVILDVRTPGEFRSGHIPGAINIPHTQLAARLAEVTPYRDDEIVVYCERSVRAGIANDILNDAGFEKIRHLIGDMSAWRDNRLPQGTSD